MSTAAVSNANIKMVPTEQWAQLPANTWAVPSVIPSATSTLLLVTETGYATPFYLDRKIAISAVAALVTSAGTASSKIRIGLYTWDPATRALGTLVKDFGQVDAATTSIQSVAASGASATIEPGWYAWAICTTAALPATIRTFLAAMAAVAGAYTISTTTALQDIHYTFTATGYAAAGLPATGPAVTAVTSATEFRPNHMVLARFSAANPAP